MEVNENTAIVMAGIPATSAAIYHRIRFSVGDPVVFLDLPDASGGPSGSGRRSLLILRDIECDRAARNARVDTVACPADFTPEGGLSGDRETATGQAAVECLVRNGIERVVGDRSLPLIYADMISRAGIALVCDPELGVFDRRRKDSQEIEWIRQSQRATEEVMQRACRAVLDSEPRLDEVLLFEGAPLTSERLKTMIEHWLIDLGYQSGGSIVACGKQGADCHDAGSGDLYTSEPVIIDIFPSSRTTRYYGDCTRTVVHGEIPDRVARLHQAVLEAKEAATRSLRAGVTGEAVHRATVESFRRAGYDDGLPEANAPEDYCAMTHGTGHGLGLECHEPPLLAEAGPELIAGDVVTIEPGLYSKAVGGVRVEDLFLVQESGNENFNSLPWGLKLD